MKDVNTKLLTRSDLEGRMRRSALALVLLAIALPGALAGCLGRSQGLDGANADDGAPPSDPVDALAHAANARALAAEWRSDATLVAVFAMEGAPVDVEDPPFLFDTSQDFAVGDGRALVWTYAFSAPNASRTFFAAMDASGVARYADDLPAGAYGGYPVRPVAVAPAEPAHAHGSSSIHAHAEEPAPFPPIGDASLRSADAAALLAANETARAWLAEHPVSVARLQIAPAPGGETWMISRSTATGYALAAVVDASTLALRELHRFPEDLWVDPPQPPCAADAMCRPGEPQPPSPPPAESHSRTVTVDAFNLRVDWPFPVSGFEWAADVVVRADVGGATPLDEVTIQVYDPMGVVVGRATGTGSLEVAFEHGEDFPWGGEYRVAVVPQVPGATPREIALTADVNYTRWLGGASYQVDSMGGYVRMRQVVEHLVRVEEGSTLLRIRYSFDEQPVTLPARATLALYDPEGNEVAVGGSPGGTFEAESPMAGDWLLRVTGEDGNALGTSYWFSASRAVPWAWH